MKLVIQFLSNVNQVDQDETFTMASFQIIQEMLSNSYTHMTKYITFALEGNGIYLIE